jgi:leucyl/phenylalanyl-tRNA--protein transferase
MFSRATDTSKIALIALCRHLEHAAIGLLDCQVGNPHLYRMGARDIPRKQFELLLGQLNGEPSETGPWTNIFLVEKRW